MIKDLTGCIFGKLTVLKIFGRDKRGEIKWLCRCECGKETVVLGSNLRTGNTASCGHVRDQKNRQRFVKHGMTNSWVYSEYKHIVSRCYNEKNQAYPNYGGRGIKVCQRWLDSFDNFYADVRTLNHFGEQGYTLNRINNDGNYILTNVEYANRKVQNRNRRNTRIVLWKGKNIPLPQAAEEENMPYKIVSNRLWRGWSLEDALTRPIKR